MVVFLKKRQWYTSNMETKTYNLAKMCEPAVTQLEYFCETYGLVGLVKADLVAVKCSSGKIYEARRAQHEEDSRFLYQSIVSNRRIAVIGLREAIKTSVGDIGCLEILDQKPGGSQIDRLTHVGIVPAGISYDELISKLKEGGANVTEIERPHGYAACDVLLPTGFSIRVQKEALIDRIKREEIN